MTLDKIAQNIKISDSLAKLYKKKSRKQPWFTELLQKSYMKLGNKIKLRSDNHEYITYQHACDTIDQISMTLACIYEMKISQLEKQYASRDQTSN